MGNEQSVIKETSAAKKHKETNLIFKGEFLDPKWIPKDLSLDLKCLKLIDVGLILIPAPILWLSSLKKLDLSQNKLVSVTGIGCLNTLTDLDLSGNALDYLPDDFRQLPNLKTLNLSVNYLTNRSFPKDLFKELTLRALNISENRISQMTREFLVYFKDIESISIHTNPWEHPELDFIKINSTEGEVRSALATLKQREDSPTKQKGGISAFLTRKISQVARSGHSRTASEEVEVPLSSPVSPLRMSNSNKTPELEEANVTLERSAAPQRKMTRPSGPRGRQLPSQDSERSFDASDRSSLTADHGDSSPTSPQNHSLFVDTAPIAPSKSTKPRSSAAQRSPSVTKKSIPLPLKIAQMVEDESKKPTLLPKPRKAAEVESIKVAAPVIIDKKAKSHELMASVGDLKKANTEPLIENVQWKETSSSSHSLLKPRSVTAMLESNPEIHKVLRPPTGPMFDIAELRSRQGRTSGDSSMSIAVGEYREELPSSFRKLGADMRSTPDLLSKKRGEISAPVLQQKQKAVAPLLNRVIVDPPSGSSKMLLVSEPVKVDKPRGTAEGEAPGFKAESSEKQKISNKNLLV